MGREDIESPTKTVTKRSPLDVPTVSEGVKIDQRPRHSTMDVLNMPRSKVFVIGLEHLYLLDAPRPWLDRPWSGYWNERVGPTTTPWTPTPGTSPWLDRKAPPRIDPPRAPARRRARPAISDMPM
jgi:hypothetical protein